MRDRQAEPSQLFEISSFSKMKVDSPQTFKELFEEWDDIKPHKYYDSDEASIYLRKLSLVTLAIFRTMKTNWATKIISSRMLPSWSSFFAEFNK